MLLLYNPQNTNDFRMLMREPAVIYVRWPLQA